MYTDIKFGFIILFKIVISNKKILAILQQDQNTTAISNESKSTKYFRNFFVDFVEESNLDIIQNEHKRCEAMILIKLLNDRASSGKKSFSVHCRLNLTLDAECRSRP